MEEQKQLTKKQNFIQVVKYALFSVSAAVVQELVFQLLDKVFQIGDYWICYLPALICSVLWNFTINRRYTFKSVVNIKVAMLKVLAFYCVFTPLSTWWGHALAGAGWNGDLILILTMVVNFVTEFLYWRFFIYRNQMNNNDVAKRDEEKARAKAAAQEANENK